MTPAFIEQIKTAYEVNGLEPEKIIESLGIEGLSITAVKAALIRYSSKYRSICKQEPEDESVYNFDNQELKEANNTIVDVMREAIYPDGSTDYKTRLNAARYIRDDKKGRLEPAKMMRGTGGFNIIQFNTSIQEAREKAAKVIADA